MHWWSAGVFAAYVPQLPGGCWRLVVVVLLGGLLVWNVAPVGSLNCLVGVNLSDRCLVSGGFAAGFAATHGFQMTQFAAVVAGCFGEFAGLVCVIAAATGAGGR